METRFRHCLQLTCFFYSHGFRDTRYVAARQNSLYTLNAYTYRWRYRRLLKPPRFCLVPGCFRETRCLCFHHFVRRRPIQTLMLFLSAKSCFVQQRGGEYVLLASAVLSGNKFVLVVGSCWVLRKAVIWYRGGRATTQPVGLPSVHLWEPAARLGKLDTGCMQSECCWIVVGHKTDFGAV